MLSILLFYMALGVIAGLLAGLLGVGGGLIIVPFLTYTLPSLGVAGDHIHHIALGTSLATIVFTSISSFMAHHRNKAVLWPIVTQVTPGILLGTFLGGQFAARVPSVYLKGFFVIFLYYVGTQMLMNIKPKASRDIPGLAGNCTAGSVIGFVSSLVGIGGGTLSVPYMTWCNVPIHKAIGTSAAIGFPIAVAGAASFLLAGWSVPGLPEYSAGYVYLPALAGISAASMCFAPFGAKLAHSLPVAKIKRCFAVLLFVVGTQMLYKLLTA